MDAHLIEKKKAIIIRVINVLRTTVEGWTYRGGL